MRGPSGPFLSLIGGQMQIIAFFGATSVSPSRTYPLVILPKPAPCFFIFLIVYKKEYIPDQFDYETGGELQQEAFWNVGWETTKKAQDTDIWKTEHEKEEKLIKECFGD